MKIILITSTDFHLQKMCLTISGRAFECNLNEESGTQINIWIQVLGGEEKAFKNLLHHLKSFQVLLSFLRFSITMETDTWELMSLPIRAWKNLYALITSHINYDTEPYRTGKNFMGKKISQASGQKKKHLKISSLTLLLPPHQSVSVQAFLLNRSCSKFPHFYKCPSSPFSSDIPFTVPVFSFTFLLLCLMCEHFFPCLLPLSTINFPSIFQQRHHISSH